MRLAVRERTGIQRQRSFWLRCFLSAALRVTLLQGTFCCLLPAQVDVQTPLHLTRVDGYVVDTAGKPVSNVEITLVRDETVAFKTRTDIVGAFHIDHVAGRYVFRVARSEFAPAIREITVRPEIVTYLERKKLYVIVGPGACMDECSSVYATKHEFDRAIKKKNKH